MKKTDIAMIILIAAVSILIAFFITNSIFGKANSEEEKVKTVEKIDTTMSEVDPRIFNKDAINPAVEVQITPGNQ